MLWVITICTSLSLWYRVIFSIFSVDCIFFCQLIFVNSSKFWWQAQLWGIAQSLQSILQLLRTFLKNYIGGLKILFVSEPTHKYIYRHIHKEISCSCILGLVKESFLIYDMFFAYFILKSYSSILENSTSKYYKSFCLNSYVFLGIMLITLKIYNYLWLPSVFEIQKIMRCLFKVVFVWAYHEKRVRMCK